MQIHLWYTSLKNCRVQTNWGGLIRNTAVLASCCCRNWCWQKIAQHIDDWLNGPPPIKSTRTLLTIGRRCGQVAQKLPSWNGLNGQQQAFEGHIKHYGTNPLGLLIAAILYSRGGSPSKVYWSCKKKLLDVQNLTVQEFDRQTNRSCISVVAGDAHRSCDTMQALNTAESPLYPFCIACRYSMYYYYWISN